MTLTDPRPPKAPSGPDGVLARLLDHPERRSRTALVAVPALALLGALVVGGVLMAIEASPRCRPTARWCAGCSAGLVASPTPPWWRPR